MGNTGDVSSGSAGKNPGTGRNVPSGSGAVSAKLPALPVLSPLSKRTVYMKRRGGRKKPFFCVIRLLSSLRGSTCASIHRDFRNSVPKTVIHGQIIRCSEAGRQKTLAFSPLEQIDTVKRQKRLID